jgi:non-specific serine/threonine protein kinase/serine/threonine-protein kinase
MPPETLSPADEALLDELFDHAVACLATGARIDVESWLAGREHLREAAESTLETARGVAVGTAPRLPHGKPPEVAGYRVLAEVGRGSMGIVYRAVQESLGRVVALKILAPSLLVSTRARERFAAEAQALARVQHPSVVTVHEVVVQPELCAYAMEWLQGSTLAQAIEAGDARLEPRRVGELGLALARALEAVHAAGLVHRDVKPSNVLLCFDGRTVLTDFGLAHSNDQGQGTASGEFLGTAAYAAPEQLRGERERIGPRSDVYSLGVTLYAALAGQTPFGTATPSAVLRRIEEGRAQPLAKLNPAVPRDLATIVAHAMEPELARRYASASELAEDLERFLTQRPIRARRASLALRGKRWVQRNPWLSVALVVLVAGAGTSTWFALEARERAEEALEQKGLAEQHEAAARSRAEENARLASEKSALASAESAARSTAESSAAEARKRAEELEQVLQFQQAQWSAVDIEQMGLELRKSVLARAQPEQREALEASLSAVNFTSVALALLEEELFVRALAAIEKGFAEQPGVKARLLLNVAEPLHKLGSLERAIAPVREALALAEQVHGARHELTLAARESLGGLLEMRGSYAEAELEKRAVYELRRELHGLEDRRTIFSLKSLAVTLSSLGRFEEAEAHATEALEIARAHLADDRDLVIKCLATVAHLRSEKGFYAEAEELYREVATRTAELHGERSTAAAREFGNLGAAIARLGRLREAEPYLQKATEIYAELLGEDHPLSIEASGNLLSGFHDHGRDRDRELRLEQLLERARRVLGEEHPTTLHLASNLGCTRGLRDPASVEQQMRAVFAGCARVLGPEHPQSLLSQKNLGVALLNNGKHAEGEALLRETTAAHRRILGAAHPKTLIAIGAHASALEEWGRVEEVRALRTEALDASRERLGKDHPRSIAAAIDLGHSLVSSGELARAEALLTQAREDLDRTIGPRSALLSRVLGELYALRFRQGRMEEAAALARERLDLCQVLYGEEHQETLVAMEGLTSVLALGRELDEAQRWNDRCVELAEKTLGAWHWTTLTARRTKALLLQMRGRLTEAAELLSEVLAAQRSQFGSKYPETLQTLQGYGMLLSSMGRLEDAERTLREAREIALEIHGAAHEGTLAIEHELGLLLVKARRSKEGEELLREVLERRMALLGASHLDSVRTRNALADLLRQLGRLAEAEAQQREVLAGFREALGPDHMDSVGALATLVMLVQMQARLEEAEPLSVEYLERARKLFGEGHKHRIVAIQNLANLKLKLKRFADAEPLYRELYEGGKARSNARDPAVLNDGNWLGVAMGSQGKHEEAAEVLREVHALRREVLGEDHPATLMSRWNLGYSLFEMERYAEVEPIWIEVLARRRVKLRDAHGDTMTSVRWLARLWIQQGRAYEAQCLLAPFERLARSRLPAYEARHMAFFLQLQGEALHGTHALRAYRPAEAKLLEAHGILERVQGTLHEETLKCARALLALYTTWNAAEPSPDLQQKLAQWQSRLSAAEAAPANK